MVCIMDDIRSIQNSHGKLKLDLTRMPKLMPGVLKFYYKKNIFKDNTETHLYDL